MSKVVALLLFLCFSQAHSNPLAEGKQLTFERSKGNCLACHLIADGEMPGNIGPPLINMKKRYLNQAALRKQIWDATLRNPNTSMPPFGRNNIISEAEIDLVVAYIWSL